MFKTQIIAAAACNKSIFILLLVAAGRHERLCYETFVFLIPGAKHNRRQSMLSFSHYAAH